MIIGTVSYDPEKVLYAEVKLDRAKWVLTIAQAISDTGAIDLEMEYDDYDEAIEALGDVDIAVKEAREKVKRAAKVGFDAVGVAIDTESVDDEEVGLVGFDRHVAKSATR
jgi:hypothetical protein